METRINVAELLRNCPSGMELGCAMFNEVYFDCIEDSINNPYPIRCYRKVDDETLNIVRFSEYGAYTFHPDAKCIIFPKSSPTWEGFVPPCMFKDGDILSFQFDGFKNRTIYIYMQHSRMNTTYYVALSGDYDSEFLINDKEGYALNGYNNSVRYATKEEKDRLFKAIKDNGYKWNEEKKFLEKLIKPKFKVGDMIQYKSSSNYKPIYTIRSIEDDRYIFTNRNYLKFGDEDKYILLKFDINTLKPFDQVLVRDSIKDKWHIQLFEKYNKTHQYPFMCVHRAYRQCIPYKGNELLHDTKDDCRDYYKTWE